MGLIVSLIFSVFLMLLFAYAVYWLDRYEKEPKVLLGGVFIWGAVVASGGAFLLFILLRWQSKQVLPEPPFSW